MVKPGSQVKTEVSKLVCNGSSRSTVCAVVVIVPGVNHRAAAAPPSFQPSFHTRSVHRITSDGPLLDYMNEKTPS